MRDFCGGSQTSINTKGFSRTQTMLHVQSCLNLCTDKLRYFTEPFDQNMFCIGFKHIMDIKWGVSLWKPTNPLVQFQGGVTYAEMLGMMHYS